MENKKVNDAILTLNNSIKKIKNDGACLGATIHEMDKIKNNFTETLNMTIDRPEINERMIETAIKASALLEEVSNDLGSRKCSNNEAYNKVRTLGLKLEDKKKLFIHKEE